MAKSPQTANDYVNFALKLMQSRPPKYFEASCVLRLLYHSIDETERPKLCKFLVQCGVALHDKSLLEYVTKIPQDEFSSQYELAKFMLNSDLHERKRKECDIDVQKQRELIFSGRSFEDAIVVCAGGEKLMKQLFCNLKSLIRARNTPGKNDLPIIIVHAHEINEKETIFFKDHFSAELNIIFFDLSDTIIISESHLTAKLLRGFQIKLAALAAIPARRVLMMDADLIWITDPYEIIEKCKRNNVHAHLCKDFWHFVQRRHEKSSSTSFLYSLYNIDFNISEFESGLLFFDRENAYKSVAMIRHFLMNFEYYFSLTFGDKDLYYLALKTQNANITISDMPQMLGTVFETNDEIFDPDLFYSQSMIQNFDSLPSHIHTTLHPIGDVGFAMPTHICDGGYIDFVQRRINTKNVGTVACDIEHATKLIPQHLYRFIYNQALRDEKNYANHA
tara:strand:- start:637 stop:1980 length:1344 start_codon:yes stop_codon:yes gene_type:complete